jgi:hypothetical protein
MILVHLAACLGTPGNGTFVGNPGANLEAAAPPTGAGDGAQATARLVRAELDPCDGGPVAVQEPAADEAMFAFGAERSTLPVQLPAGTWCRLSVVLQDVELEVPTLGASLALGDVTVVLDDGRFEVRPTEQSWTLVLGASDWLDALQDPGAEGDPQVHSALEVSLAAGSSLYNPEGTQVIRGPGLVPFQDPECDAPVEALGPVISDCNTQAGYEVYTDVAEATCAPGLFVGAIYTPRDGAGGHATVRFEVPGTHVLALSAYEETTWTVSVGPDTTLAAVLVAGYGQQRIVGTDAPVVQVPGPACGYSLPYNGGGCDTNALLEALQSAADLPVTRFDGCYDASTFRWALE